MKILALEFSSEQRSVAVAEVRESDTRIVGRASERGGRSTRAFALIERALQEAAVEREAIEAIAVGIGPGSYTGIRAAISVAQGWQLATGVKTYPVSSVEAIARQAQQAGMTGTACVVVDAQRGDFYAATYEITAEGYAETHPLKIVPAAEITERQARGEKIVGPDVSTFAHAEVLLPSADAIAHLFSRTTAIPSEQLQPIYLRETSFVKAPPPRVIS